MNHLKLTPDQLNVGELTNLVGGADCGAISVFVGTTRDSFEDKTVVRLEYEAYESMALKSLEKICEEIRGRWVDVRGIAIYHRLGVVPVKEASIVIAISSPHRADALQATEFCINSVKQKVPIWKKEVYLGAQPQWKENSEYPPKFKKFKVEFKPEVEGGGVPPHLVQIKASGEELQRRIRNFMERKRGEIDGNNVREFCGPGGPEGGCARVDAVLQKRKDSKGHLQVSRVLNTYSRDQNNSEYLTRFIPPNGVEERLQNLEAQLSLTTPTPKQVYARLKQLEDRMLYLESISPEYLNFWGKSSLPTKSVKKKVFSIQEIDSFITDLEKKLSDDKKV